MSDKHQDMAMAAERYREHKVRVLPSSHEFVSEASSSLLEAGLRAGLRLGYGCSNGNCGKCLARVVSGEVRKTRHHDYRITGAQKAGNHVLMCCNAANTDMVLEAPEASDASEVPQQQITARVKNIRIVNDDVALMHLRTPRTNRLRFLAGQHVQLGGNDMPGATHSVASCPCDDMHLHFQIPMVSGDEFSDHIFRSLKVGDQVDINGPEGDFILDEDSPRPLVFIAWRTGFAPIRSLIEHATALEVAESIHLVWMAASKEERYLDNLCRSWADALDDFYYVPVDVDISTGGINIGNTITQHLKIKPENLARHDFYIAANDVLTASLGHTLLEHGLPSPQLTTDQITHN